MKTASIIIPTFNRAHLVQRAIESAINQTYPCEVILCDHGSTDNTPEVAEKYADKIRYIRREVDNGPIACWIDGLEKSTGEIVHFTYDDDWLEPTFMEDTISLLKDDVGFVYTNIFEHNLEESLKKQAPSLPHGILPMNFFVKYLLRQPLTVSPGCAIFRREDAIKNLLPEIPNADGIYGKNSGVGEDLLLFLLTSLGYPKYACINKPLACFLSHNGSITIDAKKNEEKNKNIVNSYSNAKKYYHQQPNSISPQTKLQTLTNALLWKYRAKTLLESIKSVFN